MSDVPAEDRPETLGRNRRVEPPTTSDPVLPQRSRDEDDEGWGERVEDADRDAWYRRERPPHHE
ncbi:MAG: hypothetical protein ACR2KJ_13010 [Jatrophihabitans sp.]